MINSLHLTADGSLLNAEPRPAAESILIPKSAAPVSLKSIKKGLEQRLLAGPGSLLNDQANGPSFSGSSLSYIDEVNEVNSEPPGKPDVSIGFTTQPQATAALSQDNGSASHRPAEDDKSQSEPGEPDQAKGQRGDEANPDEANEPGANDPEANSGGLEFHGLETTGVEQVQVQLWDNTNERGVIFTAKVTVRQGRRNEIYFISPTESRKWFGKRQDTAPESLPWYEFCRDFIRPAEKAYGGDPKYRPRIGHFTAPQRWGDAKVQMPQASATLEWEQDLPVITLFIGKICHLFQLRRSERRAENAPGW
ncbi:MAG: hypothetical protein NXI19_04135, partial [Alphaproteobacteria bacterium]|nr:hypothetical protein [Alphaproteobacteria bacterium]